MASFALIVCGLILMAWGADDTMIALVGLGSITLAGIIRIRPLPL